MPYEETTTLTIACDNPGCPGNSLNPADRTGWLYVSSEVYAEGPQTQHVYCCTACASADHEAFDVRTPPVETPTEPGAETPAAEPTATT